MHSSQIKALLLLFLVLLTSAVVACSKNRDTSFMIRVDGSSTMFPLAEAIAEEFQKSNPSRVVIGIYGTGGGFKKLCRGEIDLVNASRPITQQEIESCQTSGIDFIELPVAYDALTIIVHPDNDFIESISLDELRTIWGSGSQGTVKRWNQVNPFWPDRPLRLYGPGADSGTFEFFTRAIMGSVKASRGDYAASEDDNQIVRGVSGDIGALGYLGFAYALKNRAMIKTVPIEITKAGKPVLPTIENVLAGDYHPLSRPLFIYINASSAESANVSEFINFYLQHKLPLIAEVSLIPLPSDIHSITIDHWRSKTTGARFSRPTSATHSLVQ